jgi:hypothetical protein
VLKESYDAWMVLPAGSYDMVVGARLFGSLEGT